MKTIGNSLFACSIAAAFSTIPTAPASAARSIECGPAYTVVRGDSLSGISLRAYGSLDFDFLYQQNLAEIGGNPNMIRVGQVLQIACLVADGTASDAAPEAEVTAVSVEIDATAGDQPVILTFNKASAPGFIINTGIIDNYIEEIAEVTEGRVQFVDPEVINRDPTAQYDMVMSGDVDAAYVLNDKLRVSHPLLKLPMLPLMGGSAEQTAVSLWRLHDEYLSETGYFDEVKLMGFVAAPAAHIWRESSDPVRADEGISDKNVYPVPYFKDLDVQGPAVLRESVASWMQDYQAQNTAPPTFFLAHGAARALGVWTDDVTVTEVDYGVYTPTFSVILSNDAWAEISPEDQDAILSVSGERLASRSASWDAFDNGFRADMLVNGLKFVKADQALLDDLRVRKAEGLEVWMSAADALGVPGRAALAAYQQNLVALEDRLLFK